MVWGLRAWLCGFKACNAKTPAKGRGFCSLDAEQLEWFITRFHVHSTCVHSRREIHLRLLER